MAAKKTRKIVTKQKVAKRRPAKKNVVKKKVAKKTTVKKKVSNKNASYSKAGTKDSDKEKLKYLTGVLKKWKHTVFFDGDRAYIAHHIDKKDLRIFNSKHIHKIKLKK